MSEDWARERYEAGIFDDSQSQKMDAIFPLLRLRQQILDFSLPEIRIYKGGRTEKTYNLTNKQKESLRQIDKTVEHLKNKYDKALKEKAKYFIYFRCHND